MKKQTEEICKKYDFFDDEEDKSDVKIKSDTEMDDIETVLYASPKRENDIDDIETITYASPKRENHIDDRETLPMLPQEGKAKIKLTKKIYKKPKLETAVEIEKQTAEREKKL